MLEASVTAAGHHRAICKSSVVSSVSVLDRDTAASLSAAGDCPAVLAAAA
nr:MULTISPECIES: hypothetical protein [unclassified Mycolicibacterium]